MKRYILIAGANGTGKSTLYQTLTSLTSMERVNTDEIVRDFGNWKNPADVMRAGKMAISLIEDYFQEGISFNQETTLCGKSIFNHIQKARELGYYIELHYVGVESVDIAKERIAYRVLHGGHGIPEKDIERRYEDSFEQLRKALPLCDCSILYDNTRKINRFAVYESGKLVELAEERPMWFTRIADHV